MWFDESRWVCGLLSLLIISPRLIYRHVLSLLMYVELGVAFPFSGAEVVYVRLVNSSTTRFFFGTLLNGFTGGRVLPSPPVPGSHRYIATIRSLDTFRRKLYQLCPVDHTSVPTRQSQSRRPVGKIRGRGDVERRVSSPSILAKDGYRRQQLPRHLQGQPSDLHHPCRLCCHGWW